MEAPAEEAPRRGDPRPEEPPVRGPLSRGAGRGATSNAGIDPTSRRASPEPPSSGEVGKEKGGLAAFGARRAPGPLDRQGWAHDILATSFGVRGRSRRDAAGA